MRYRRGDKVRILDKTRDMNKYESSVYKKCMRQGGWGYIDEDNGNYLHISYKMGETTGGFNYSDVAPFVQYEEYPTSHKALSAYIRGIITEDEYVAIKRYHEEEQR